MRENKWLGRTDDELRAAIAEFADAEDRSGSSGHLWPGLARALSERFGRLAGERAWPPQTTCPDDEDGRRFQTAAETVRTFAAEFLREWFGERCPDFEANCTNCRRWAALDDLIANPWAAKPQ
jgi:hypothetical protein